MVVFRDADVRSQSPLELEPAVCYLIAFLEKFSAHIQDPRGDLKRAIGVEQYGGLCEAN